MEELGSGILKYYELIKGVSFILFILFVAWYFYAKAGSNYSMMSRFWSLIVGKKNFSNTEMKGLMQEREDIDKFNFIFNVKATNIEQIERLQKRIKKQGIDIRLISRSKGHFYINTCKLKVPTQKKIFGMLLISTVLFFCTLPLLQFAIKPAAVLQYHDSGAWAWVNNQYAEKYIPAVPVVSSLFEYWRFDNETCASKDFSIDKLSAITKLTKKEIEATCSLFKNDRNPPVISRAIKGQKIFYFIFLFPLLFSLLSFRAFIYMIYTYDLRHALLKKKGKIKPKHNAKYVGP